MPRRSSDSIIFDSLDLEGVLFIPAVLEKAARGELPDQRTPADYRIPAGLSLLDEQGRSFRIASALFHTFDGNRSRSDVDASRVTEGFIKDLFRDAFGYSDFSVCQGPVAVGDRGFPVTALTCAGRVPVIVAPHALDLDTPHERFAILGSGARRRSAYQLAQQFLNASTDCTWALVTNGRQLRLLRDADTLTRPAYLEADLELILREQRYADFAAVWRIFHASRAGQTNAEASWESWRKQGQDQGERVREGLREGVTQALLAFGSGFLAHPNNHDLRARLEAGDLSVDAFFQQLLRLIYRCLFVFTAEERGLLHVEDNNPAARVARETYAAGYAFRRLRDRALRRSGFDRHGDLWTGSRLVFRGLAAGEPRLALPALGGLFASSQCPDLDRAHLENRALLDAMRHLRWSGQGGSLAAIDYRNMGPEELGSVYESLLELVPTVDLPARTFGFIGLTSEGLTGGNARKTSGSYYTPDSLVQELLDSALDPVIQARIAEAVGGGEWRVASSEWSGLNVEQRRYFEQAIHGVLSRSGGVAAGDELSYVRVCLDQILSQGGVVRPDQPDTAGRRVDTSKCGRGLGQTEHAGVSALPDHRERESPRVGNPSSSLAARPVDEFRADSTSPRRRNDPRQTTAQSISGSRAEEVSGEGDEASGEGRMASGGGAEGSGEGGTDNSVGQFIAPNLEATQLASLWSSLPLATRHSLLASEAVLSLSVIDPACGSGHFLLAAARRLAERLAEIRGSAECFPSSDVIPSTRHSPLTTRHSWGAVTPGDYRHALREVIARCIHGVDRNPMALELARTALWLEGYEPGQPLSFLDHHLVCGDALLGLVDFKTLTAGIPADAFKALTGDDKEVCKRLAAANRAALKTFERRRKDPDFFREADTVNLLQELAALEAMPESTPAEVEAKAGRYTAFLQHARDSRLAQAADLLIAAFLTPKDSVTATELCPTTQTVADLLFPRQDGTLRPEVLDHARLVCRKARVLHWPTAFAGVFARGGFDCVLGNPPWERIKIQEQEYFASRHPTIATAANASARQRLIAGLAEGSEADRRLLQEFKEAKRLAEAASMFFHVSANEGGRFPLTGVGDVNTYALFAETMAGITARVGRSGFIVPTGIATDDSTKDFFASLVEAGRIVAFYSFENEEFVFPSVHHAFKFSLFVISGDRISSGPEFLFFARQVDYLREARRRFTLNRDEFQLINPNTRTCPVFRTQADAELTKAIYRRVPVLIREPTEDQPERNPWGISFSTMFHMSNDSGLFLNAPTPTGLPLYEAKMLHQFDHRWATYRWDAEEGEAVTEDVSDAEKARPDFVVQPRYWVEERHVLSRLAPVPRCVTKAWDDQSEDALRDAFAIWIASGAEDDDLAELRGEAASARQRVIDAGGRLFATLPARESKWFNPKAAAEARNWPALTTDELTLLRDAPDCLAAAHAILDHRSPRWLMGWRDITNATNERTVLASVVPRTAVGNKIPLIFPSEPAVQCAALLGNLCSLVLDYVARQKIGGTTLNFFIIKQFPVLPPSAYTETDLAYIVPRVLELTYTAHDLRPWYEDVMTSHNACGHSPLPIRHSPFPYDPARRAILRAELDAWYARLYGLTRDELRYILDPSDTHGPDYPTETFRGLKTNEMRAHGEYRTRRLVLEAWDAQNR